MEAGIEIEQELAARLCAPMASGEEWASEIVYIHAQSILGMLRERKVFPDLTIEQDLERLLEHEPGPALSESEYQMAKDKVVEKYGGSSKTLLKEKVEAQRNEIERMKKELEWVETRNETAVEQLKGGLEAQALAQVRRESFVRG